MSFDAKAFEKWAKNVTELADEGMVDFFEDETKKGGLMTLRNVRKVTRDEHTDTGNMLKSWQITSQVEKKGKTYSITIFNTAHSEASEGYPSGAPYPFYLEYGRRIVKDGRTVGYMPGFHLLEGAKKKATKTLTKRANRDFKAYLEKALEE